MENILKYISVIHKEKDSDYGVSFPDFPSCITAGKTLEEAITEASEVLQFHIDGMVEDGLEIPKPSKLEDLKNEDLDDKFLMLIKIKAYHKN